jgi:hypothetical protein
LRDRTEWAKLAGPGGSVVAGGVVNETALGFIVVTLVIAVLVVLAREGVLIQAIFNLIWTGE